MLEISNGKSLAASRTRLTGPIADKCLVHLKAYPTKPLDRSPNPMLLPHEQSIYTYGDSIKEILFSRVTNITRLVPGP
jgi:hypothetical protein